MPILSLAQTLLFALMMLTLPTTAHTPQKQLPPPQKEDKPAVEHQYTTFEVTAYTANDENMDGRGITANQTKAIPWRTVASSRHYPIGTRIYIPELKRTVVVEDRFASAKKEKELKIPADRLDLYVGLSNKKDAYRFGRRKLKGIVLP